MATTRRPHYAGGLKPLGDDRWRLRIRLDNGKRISRTIRAANQRDAERALNELRARATGTGMAGERRTVNDLLDSRPWIALSIGCSLFALYEAVVKMVAGQTIEGVLDAVLAVVFVINFVNRFKALTAYVNKLLSR